ncbi:hypothetical protein, partial [Streptomyces tendae]
CSSYPRSVIAGASACRVRSPLSDSNRRPSLYKFDLARVWSQSTPAHGAVRVCRLPSLFVGVDVKL